MFIHTIPSGFSIGIINIRYYGIIYALGFLITYLYLNKKREFLQLNQEQLDKLFLYILLGNIIGARLFEFIFYNPSIFITNPLEILKIWHGGLSFHGAVIGIVTAIYLFKKKHKLNIYKLTDTLVLPAAIMLFFGRIANFINAELLGRITTVPWAVNFNNEQTINQQLIGRHPSQLYEALKNLCIFAYLTYINYKEQKTKNYKPGYKTWIFIFLYGVLRALTNIYRDDTLIFFNILSMGQILSLMMALIALFVLYNKYWLIPKK